MRGYHPELILAELTNVDDSGVQQLIDHYGLAGEQHTKVYRPQYFGLSSRPPKGSTGLILSLGGERSRSVLLGGEHDSYRPKNLNDGETKLYDADGNVIYLAKANGISVSAQNGDVVVKTAGGQVRVTSNENVYVSGKGNIYLGSADGSGCAQVQTVSGPSDNVFAHV